MSAAPIGARMEMRPAISASPGNTSVTFLCCPVSVLNSIVETIRTTEAGITPAGTTRARSISDWSTLATSGARSPRRASQGASVPSPD
jgi:hypothetical protein